MAGRSTEFRVAMRPGKRRALPDTPDGKLQGLVETAKAHIRAKGEHPLRVIKQQFGFQNTLPSGSGSCRDFATLFLAAARLLGLVARFVSGYLHDPLHPEAGGSTHAWAGVDLPGAGWTGFDPTMGSLPGPDPIAVAVSHRPDGVPPVAGSFRGSAPSRLTVGVWVTAIT